MKGCIKGCNYDCFRSSLGLLNFSNHAGLSIINFNLINNYDAMIVLNHPFLPCTIPSCNCPLFNTTVGHSGVMYVYSEGLSITYWKGLVVPFVSNMVCGLCG